VKSKRIMAEGFPPEVAEEDGEANRHWRAAFRAATAKNWLGAGFASSAVETVPSGLICTRTLMRTVPRMVERDLSETSGRALRRTAGESGCDDGASGATAERAGTDLLVPEGALVAPESDAEFVVPGRGFAFGEEEIALDKGALARDEFEVEDAGTFGAEESPDGAGLEAGEVTPALEFGEGASVDGADAELAGGIFASRAAEFGAEEAALGFAEFGVDEFRERRK
jgi:hypothetical protein